jgi:hypothetical protein
MTTSNTYDSTVNSFYLAFYGRPADPAGLHFWSQQLQNSNGDFGAIVDAFANSQEAQVRFGSDDTTARVTEIYQQLFNRAPDAEGMAFWLKAIDNGDASIADVALSVVNGAQGSDAQLVTLRQQAMDQFTAQVEASGSAYTGDAAIEAARILVRAVTLGATQDDIDSLVKSAVSFADTATKTPAVVAAIATGTTLSALFDTVRGTNDPVALAEALAGTAKAAAGNPDTLASLLRGGGMAQVLKVMPAAATLQDVVDALATGGLPAAVEVVYPSTPTTTPVAFSLAFSSVSESTLDSHKLDNVTNQATADVTFHYTGKNLTGAQHFEYSLDGTTWSTADVVVSTSSKLVTVQNVDLTQGVAASVQNVQGVHVFGAILEPADLHTTVYLRAVDASNQVIKSVSQDIVYDSYAKQVSVVLAQDTYGAQIGTDHDQITSKAAFTVTGVEDNATLQYHANQVTYNRTMSTNESVEWVNGTPTLHEGLNSFSVRQVDAAGNIGDEHQYSIILDTVAPAAPTIALHSTENTSSSSTDSTSTIDISGMEKGALTNSAWQYSTDGGAHWIYGGTNAYTGVATLDLAANGVAPGDYEVMVRLYDAAGNVGEASNQLDVTVPEVVEAEESYMSGVTPHFTVGEKFSLTLGATPYGIVADATSENGLVNAPSLGLVSYDNGPQGNGYHFNGTEFSLVGSTLTLEDATLKLDAYMLSWDNDTFLTSGPSGSGYVGSASMLFAGGVGSNVAVNGIKVDTLGLVNEGFEESDQGTTNTMYVVQGTSAVTINTGDGMDVVRGGNAPLTLVYDKFANSAQDLVLGFHNATDVIQLSAALSTTVDTDHDGFLDAVDIGTSTNVVLENSIELMAFTQSGMMATDLQGADGQQTLDTLNLVFANNEMGVGDHMLLLAQSADNAGESMLLYYDEKAGNGHIDLADLTIVATFSQGALEASSIHLVGIQGP